MCETQFKQKKIIKMLSSPNCTLHGGSTLDIKLKKNTWSLKKNRETPFKQKFVEVLAF